MVINLQLSDVQVSILSIDVYPNNQNVDPTAETFSDLTPQQRRAVINHINRKYPGKVIHT